MDAMYRIVHIAFVGRYGNTIKPSEAGAPTWPSHLQACQPNILKRSFAPSPKHRCGSFQCLFLHIWSQKTSKRATNVEPPASKKIRRELLDVVDGKLLLSARTSQSTENVNNSGLFKQENLGSRSKPAIGSMTCFVAMGPGQICEKISDLDVTGDFSKFMASHWSVVPFNAPHKTCRSVSELNRLLI